MEDGDAPFLRLILSGRVNARGRHSGEGRNLLQKRWGGQQDPGLRRDDG